MAVDYIVLAMFTFAYINYTNVSKELQEWFTDMKLLHIEHVKNHSSIDILIQTLTDILSFTNFQYYKSGYVQFTANSVTATQARA